MDAVAASRMAGLAYVGIVYEGPVPAYVRDVPAGGCDILSTKVYWRFPAGAVRCLSVRDLVRAHLADLDAAETRDAYDAVASSLGYTCLGYAEDASALEAFAHDSGT